MTSQHRKTDYATKGYDRDLEHLLASPRLDLAMRAAWANELLAASPGPDAGPLADRVALLAESNPEALELSLPAPRAWGAGPGMVARVFSLMQRALWRGLAGQTRRESPLDEPSRLAGQHR